MISSDVFLRKPHEPHAKRGRRHLRKKVRCVVTVYRAQGKGKYKYGDLSDKADGPAPFKNDGLAYLKLEDGVSDAICPTPDTRHQMPDARY